jgi:Holliday junction resolvase
MRRAAKTDDNHRSIVKALRKAGCNVLSLAAVGNGCPDLLIQRLGVLYLLEVKDGEKYPSQQKLTPHQVKFRKDWIFHVVNSETQALEAVGAMQ